MIIDVSYFYNGELAIPNIKTLASISDNLPKSNDDVTAIINRYERELLVNALGFENYTELSTQFEGVELKTDALEKWTDLVNGKTYINNGVTYRWDGLRQHDVKESLVAYYVYYHYLYKDAARYTGTGMQREQGKGSNEVDPMPKLVDVWRQFIDKYQGVNNTHPTLITTNYGFGVDWLGSNRGSFVSLYQFLVDNDEYGDYEFKAYGNLNKFGI